MEEQKGKLEGEIQNKEQHEEKLEESISQLEEYAAALDIKEEDLIVPTLKTSPLVKDVSWLLSGLPPLPLTSVSTEQTRVLPQSCLKYPRPGWVRLAVCWQYLV